jgi:hypothetical protein|tara:strand:+ start:10987 stop:11403 length:417 start_codon:yes stop_codon:yes gene_type:complete
MSEQPAWSGPGVIFSFFKLRESSEISQEAMHTWFDEEFVPSLLATGTIKSVTLYKAANPNYNKQQLLLYDVPDLSSIQAGQLGDFAKSSRLSLCKGSIDAHVEFEWRTYSFVQLYETSKRSEGKLKLGLQVPMGGSGC